MINLCQKTPNSVEIAFLALNFGLETDGTLFWLGICLLWVKWIQSKAMSQMSQIHCQIGSAELIEYIVVYIVTVYLHSNRHNKISMAPIH
jgi:hypothetical protein